MHSLVSIKFYDERFKLQDKWKPKKNCCAIFILSCPSKKYTMRNLLIFGLFVILLVMVQSVHAQTADDIIDKYINALGGKEKLLSLNSIKMTGSLSIQGTDINLTVTKLNNVGARTDIEVMGTSNYQIVTATKGISFMPVQGMSSPTDMTEEQFKSSQTQLDIQSALLNYKDKGTTVELAGTEKIGDEDNYKLKVTFKNGIVTNYFIGSKNFRLNKTSGKRNVNGEDMDIETSFSNYKQNADGFWFSYTNNTMQGEINFDKIDTNIKVDASLFKEN
jgi:hypothetical protein